MNKKYVPAASITVLQRICTVPVEESILEFPQRKMEAKGSTDESSAAFMVRNTDVVMAVFAEDIMERDMEKAVEKDIKGMENMDVNRFLNEKKQKMNHRFVSLNL